MQYDKALTISVGRSRKETDWKQQTLMWSEFVQRLSMPVRSTETLEEYKAMHKAQQDELKDVGGYVGGVLEGNRRRAGSVKSRCLITLDMDSILPGGTEDILRRVGGLSCAYVVSSTRKHEGAAPRLRAIIPTDRDLTADEYEPAARKLAQMIGIDYCDPTTFRVEQFMFWPSCCQGAEYVYGTGENPSRYGPIAGLDATTEEFTLKNDRSFTFAIDKLDTDETVQQLSAAAALARQDREVVIPEVDSYVYGVMAAGAGYKPAAKALTNTNIYGEITAASNALDNAEVPETQRVLLVTPDTYMLMKQCKDIVLETEIGADMRIRGVIANLDGALVLKVPAARLPKGFGFLLAHPCACVAPTKLEDYKIHQDPPGISGALVEGRICYDAFILENKTKAIYYQAQPET